MNKNVKKPLLLGSVMVVGLGLSAAFAQIHVKSDLSNAIQNIQKVYFSPEGIKHPDPSKNILVEMEGGVLRIHGKVIAENANTKNTLSSGATNALLIQGTLNKNFGKDVVMVGGDNNIATGGSESITILGGLSNAASPGAQQGVLFAGKNNEIKNGSNSAIAAGAENLVEGKNSFVAGGQIVEIKGDNSFAAGRNIKQADTPKNSVFLWSDSKLRKVTETDLKPAQDDTFLIRAANGVAIGKNAPVVKGLDVQGLVQIGDQEVICSAQTKGAIRYVGDTKGCFCTCNGAARLAMSQSKNCMRTCSNAKGTAPVTPTVEDPRCGSAIGTCLLGNPTSPQTQGNTATWSCVNGTKSRECNATCPTDTILENGACKKKNTSRIVSCPSAGKPTGKDIKIGAGVYSQTTNDGGTSRSPTKTSWTYTTSATLNACEWSCEKGYKRNGNTCMALPQCNPIGKNYYFFRENGIWNRDKQRGIHTFNVDDLRFEWKKASDPNYAAGPDLYYEENQGKRKTFCSVGVPVATDGGDFLTRVWGSDGKSHGRQFTYKCKLGNELSDTCTVGTNIPNAEIKSIDRTSGRGHGLTLFCKPGYEEKGNSCVKDNAPACGTQINTCVHGTAKTIDKQEYDKLLGITTPTTPEYSLVGSYSNLVKEVDSRVGNHALLNELMMLTDWSTTCDSRNKSLQEERNRYWTCNISSKQPAVCSASADYPQIKLCDKSAIVSNLRNENSIIKDGCYKVFKREKDSQPDWEFLGPYTKPTNKTAIGKTLDLTNTYGCTYGCKIGEVYDSDQKKCIKAESTTPIYDLDKKTPWYYGRDGSCCFSKPGLNANSPRDILVTAEGIQGEADSAGRLPGKDPHDPYWTNPH